MKCYTIYLDDPWYKALWVRIKYYFAKPPKALMTNAWIIAEGQIPFGDE